MSDKQKFREKTLQISRRVPFPATGLHRTASSCTVGRSKKDGDRDWSSASVNPELALLRLPICLEDGMLRCPGFPLLRFSFLYKRQRERMMPRAKSV
jgi:hypothetical protein